MKKIALHWQILIGIVGGIIVTATLASIGAAAVPGAGILMLVIVLESIRISPAGIALIFAIDRPLDMFRTVTNISGDSMVALVMDRSGRGRAELVKNGGA